MPFAHPCPAPDPSPALLSELRASEERFHTLASLSSNWYWEQDAELRFVQVTEGRHNFGGVPREAHVGKRRWELPHTEIDGGDWSAHIADLEAHRPFHDLLLRRTLPEGQRWVRVSGEPRFAADGTFLGYRGVARDVTEKQEARLALIAARDAANAASRAKSEFLANMSHEIRTPMNGILGMAGMLLDAELPPRERHFASTMHRSAVALLKVINDILDFSKIEAGKLEFEALDFDLHGLLDETLQAFASAADAKRIELAGEARAGVPGFARGDPGRIRQVLCNLIGNAIKFTARGEVVVEASVAESTSDDLLLRFQVCDSGIGIEADALESIFEPFTQADGSTTRRYGGTGLGLTISRQLVTMMGGTIGVSSRRGQGSCFWFTVRVGRSARQRTAPAPALAGRRVLVVDDSTTNLEIVQHQLAAAGIDACGVTNARDALRQLDGASYDVAILDMHMPGLDGLALAQRIRERTDHAAMRIVMLSSIGRDLPRELLAPLDIGGALTKPVGAAPLLRELERVLGGVPAASGKPPPAQPYFEGHVLVAEDNEVNRVVAASMLESFGLSVEFAFDGREAVAMAARGAFDLVLMDCQMPELDGFDATAAIRALETGCARSVIVAVTAHAMDGDRQRCLAAGMDDYLSKPFERAQLARVLRRWLPQRPALEAMSLAGEFDALG